MSSVRSVAVAVLDRDEWEANTDIMVVANPDTRSLTWMPRDVWSYRYANRVSRAFIIGGGRAMMKGLGDLGYPCSDFVVLRRGATEAALADVRVTVPVEERLDFWYPLYPTQPIEDGRKQISFEPPEEVLEGERVHQWIGARYGFGKHGSDLYRIKRQQVLLKVLLATGFDFASVLADPQLVEMSGSAALETLARVDDSWSCSTFDDVEDAKMGRKAVLVPRSRKLRRRGRVARIVHRLTWRLWGLR